MKKIKNKIKNNFIYLYNVEEEHVPKIPEDIIKKRIQLLETNLKNLLDVHYLKRDSKRINSVLKAIEFWKNI